MQTSSSSPVVVYTPQSQLRRPRQLWLAMWHDLVSSRELAWRLFMRDLSAQYRQSLLGVIWAFFPPLVTSLVFIALRANNVVNFAETSVPYPVFVLVGTILWQIFTESINAPLRAVNAARSMLVRINFPREALIVSAVYGVLFNLLIKSLVLAGIFLYFRVPMSEAGFFGLASMFSLVLLGVCLGLLLTPVGMLYSDISSALPIALQIWFFITPVVYPVPPGFAYSWVVHLNPVTPLLNGTRDLLTRGVVSNPWSLLWVNLISLFLLLVGWVIYRVSLPIIIERMSA